MKKMEIPSKRRRVGRYAIAIADRHNARNDFSRRDRLYYQVPSVTVPFRPGDRLQPVCLMIMSYNCFIENMGGPGARGPGARAPMAPLLIRHCFRTVWLGFAVDLVSP